MSSVRLAFPLLFLAAAAVVDSLLEGARGRLPTQLTTTGLAYEGNAVADAKVAVEGLQQQMDNLQQQLDGLAELTLGGE